MKKKNKDKSWIEIFEECKHKEHVALFYCEILRRFDKYFGKPSHISAAFQVPLRGKNPIENEHRWYKFHYYQKEDIVIAAMNEASQCWDDFYEYARALMYCWNNFNIEVEIAIKNLIRTWEGNFPDKTKRNVARDYIKAVDIWMHSTKVLKEEQDRIDREGKYLRGYYTAFKEICEYYKITGTRSHFRFMLAVAKDKDCWILCKDKDQIDKMDKELQPKAITLAQLTNLFPLRESNKPLIIDPAIWCELFENLV